MLSRRCFSTCRITRSYIGSSPIKIPSNVTVTNIPALSQANPSTIVIQGPRGELKVPLASFVQLQRNQDTLQVSVNDASVKKQRSMWGTTRALLFNSITGVTDGYQATLKFVGVGYRAAVENNTVILRVGYSKPVVLELPKGVTATCPQPTALILEGHSKQGVKQFAATIRSYRQPEPYKGRFLVAFSDAYALLLIESQVRVFLSTTKQSKSRIKRVKSRILIKSVYKCICHSTVITSVYSLFCSLALVCGSFIPTNELSLVYQK